MTVSVCMTRTRIAFAILGILVGVSVFITFSISYHNWDVAIWGLTSGVFATITLAVHIIYMKTEWKMCYRALKPLILTGCIGQLASITGFTVYMTLAITEHQELTAYGPRAFYMGSVWCAMTWKWAFLLFYFSRSYRNLVQEFIGPSSDIPYQSV